MATNVYVDAFNLYYGCLKNTSYRWLNLSELCRLMLPKDHINQIKYFTARVSARPSDPSQPIRQQTYLRALRTLPNLSIIYGSFLTHEVMMPLADSKSGKLQYARVIKTEEKGSDVNIATHLLNDAYQNDYDFAVIISNDSDLLSPIEIVSNQLGKDIGILNPHKNPSRALLPVAKFYKPIRKGVLAASQFSDVLSDSHGKFHKPASW